MEAPWPVCMIFIGAVVHWEEQFFQHRRGNVGWCCGCCWRCCFKWQLLSLVNSWGMIGFSDCCRPSSLIWDNQSSPQKVKGHKRALVWNPKCTGVRLSDIAEEGWVEYVSLPNEVPMWPIVLEILLLGKEKKRKSPVKSLLLPRKSFQIVSLVTTPRKKYYV